MIPESDTILAELQKISVDGYAPPPARVSSQIPILARLMVLVADDQAKSAQKLEEQKSQLIFFTKVLVGLTVALFLLTAYLSYDAYLKNKAIDQAQHSSTK